MSISMRRYGTTFQRTRKQSSNMPIVFQILIMSCETSAGGARHHRAGLQSRPGRMATAAPSPRLAGIQSAAAIFSLILHQYPVCMATAASSPRLAAQLPPTVAASLVPATVSHCASFLPGAAASRCRLPGINYPNGLVKQKGVPYEV